MNTTPALSPQPAPQRIGLLGGAFDPPHHAHRALAQAALAQLQLDRLLILPTGQAWHKARPLTASAHRLAMCQAAFGDLDRVSIDARETQRAGPTYTVDTLTELRQEHPHARFYLLMGADQWAAFTGWHRWRDVAEGATLVVAPRPVAEPTALATTSANPDAAAPGEDLRPSPQWLDMPPVDLSATAIRSALSRSPTHFVALQQLVPEPVARYISQHHLYTEPT